MTTGEMVKHIPLHTSSVLKLPPDKKSKVFLEKEKKKKNKIYQPNYPSSVLSKISSPCMLVVRIRICLAVHCSKFSVLLTLFLPPPLSFPPSLFLSPTPDSFFLQIQRSMRKSHPLQDLEIYAIFNWSIKPQQLNRKQNKQSSIVPVQLSTVAQGTLKALYVKEARTDLAKQLRLGPSFLTALSKDGILKSFMNFFQTKSKTFRNVLASFHPLSPNFLQSMFCFILWPSPLDSPMAPFR